MSTTADRRGGALLLDGGGRPLGRGAALPRAHDEHMQRARSSLSRSRRTGSPHPPLTYLKPTGLTTEITFDDVTYTVIDVVPHFPS